MTSFTLNLFYTLLLVFRFSDAFIAYDCSGLNMNVTTISLLHNKQCTDTLTPENVTSVNIQLIQKSDIKLIETFQCYISIRRSIYYCGMHSHVSVVQNSMATLVKTVGDQNCRMVFNSKTISLTQTKIITDLRINHTTHRPITLAGTINVDGSCKGESYSDFYGSWDNVIVLADVSVTLKHNFDIYNFADNQVTLKSGMRCQYTLGYCFDTEYGDTYWNFMNTNTCQDDSFDVLYEGPSNKIISYQEELSSNVISNYFVENDGSLFALRTTKQISLCGQLIYQTEHPKLMIIEDRGQGFIHRQRVINPLNLDMFTYINTKFVYLEKHIKSQIISLYRDIVHQRCKLETQVINNLLTLAFISPNDFAYMYMKGPGYTAQVMGEVIHIIKCQAVEVSLRTIDKCYLELPVEINNTTQFMTPRTHLLLNYGTEISCNELLAPHYFLSNTWYSFSPQKHIMIPPHDFGIIAQDKWRYVDINHLSTDGIYTKEELNQLRDHIMYPMEKHSVENIMIRNFMGLKPDFQSQKGSFLLTPYDMDNLTQSVTDKMWKYITNFGNISSGVFGIYMLYLLLKHLLALVFNGISLYKTLGCGFHLLGSICTSLTHLILNYNKPQNNKPPTKEENMQAKDEVITMDSPSYPCIASCPDPKYL